jgi:hypothetical protein
MIENCPNVQSEMDKNIKLQQLDYNEMNLTYYPILKKMSSLFNIDLPAMNLTRLNALFDSINVDLYLNRPLPKDLLPNDLDNLEHLHNWYNHFVVSHNLSKMYNTYKFNKIIELFDTRIKSPDAGGLKWTTLSAEENDLIAAQVDLNISSSKCIE